MNHRSVAQYFLCSVATCTIIASAPSYAQSDHRQRDNDGSEIVVTGERQARSILDTQTSVSVITKDEIERSGQRSIYDVIAGTPNLTPAPGDFLPPIRGENTSGAGGLGGAILFGTIPTATLIVDDIARSSNYSNSAFTSIFDVQQVEVLRGPQTTLRGANALAGAYLIQTKSPKFDTEGEVLAEFTHDAITNLNRRFAAMGNIVIKDDQVALRVVVERMDGKFSFNVADTNPFIPAPAGVHLNDARRFHSTRARAKLRIEPGSMPEFSANISGEYETGLDQGSKSFINNETFNGGVPLSRRIFGYGNGRTFDVTNYAVGLNMAYDFGRALIRSITSYQKSELSLDETASDKRTGFDQVDQEIFNQDLLVSFGSKGDVIRGLVGGSYSRTKNINRLSGFPFTDNGSNHSEALFADLQIRLVPQLSLQIGGRLNHTKISRDNDIFGGFVSARVRQNETVFLPKFGADFELTDTQTIGLSARKGYNPGNGGVDFGLFVPYEWKSERVWTYEATYRGQFANNRLTMLGSVFLNDGTNKQFLLNSETVPNSFQVFNVPQTRSYGIELQLRANVSKELDFNASAGILNTKILKAPLSAPSIQNNRFGLDPAFTGSISISWRPIDGLDLGASANYVTGYLGDFNQDSASKSGDYTIMNISAGYTTGGITFRMFLNNITDKFAIFQSLPSSGAYVLSPRTLGGNVRIAF